MEYLKSMTVKELREIAKQAKIPGYSTMRKAELIAEITDDIIKSQIEAEIENENIVKDDEFMYAGILWTGPAAKVLKAHDKMIRRFNPEMTRDKDGIIKLTPRQRRRVHKNDRRNAKRFGLEKVNA